MFSTKCVLLPSKKNKISTVNVLLLQLPQLSHLFFISNYVILLTEAQEYFLPQEAGYPSYATA